MRRKVNKMEKQKFMNLGLMVILIVGIDQFKLTGQGIGKAYEWRII